METIPGLAGTPTLADIEKIVGLEDPIVRNLQITQCYHDLTVAFADRLPGGANWCAFATWASKQAGQTIRREDLQRSLESVFNRSPALEEALRTVAVALRSLGANAGMAEIRQRVVDLIDPAGAAARASDAVARGNLKVFAEIGRAFAAFLQTCSADSEHNPVTLSLFTAGLREGDPPDGQRLLRDAFTHYYRAQFESDPRRRAELLLLANLQVGMHEQTRLQPEILEALNVAIPDAESITPRLIAAVLPRQAAWLTRTRRALTRLLGGPTPLDLAVGMLVDSARREMRRVLTDGLMTLSLPRGERLRLGNDLRARFPASLDSLELVDLVALLSLIDPTRDSVTGSGAGDWGDLPERMHFIADLFRCLHESSVLFDPPFDANQQAAIRAGRRPAGIL
jgi:hypothetical protein